MTIGAITAKKRPRISGGKFSAVSNKCGEQQQKRAYEVVLIHNEEMRAGVVKRNRWAPY